MQCFGPKKTTKTVLKKNMKELIEKLISLIKDLEREYGSPLICALFLRDGVQEKWDMLISAMWLNSKNMQSHKIISSKLQESLNDSELALFYRLVIPEPSDPVIAYLKSLETIKNGVYNELPTNELTEKFKYIIKKAYLLP